MISEDREHFCTLFDSNFLPYGLSLLESLEEHCPNFKLWILCMDKLAEAQLKSFNLKNIELIHLDEIENDRLLQIKESRSKGEYCWTLTPFLPGFILNKSKEIKRITYLDADLFFFESPKTLIRELLESKKDVLITEHAFAPEYDQSEKSGRFCVQFLTFQANKGAFEILNWWQDRCIEWCFNRCEEGKFGDQKYLDQWPTLFCEKIHILEQKSKTQAPWNANFFSDAAPVFFHFHGLRIISDKKIRLFLGYEINRKKMLLYKKYIDVFKRKITLMQKNGIPIPILPEKNELFQSIREWKRKITRTTAFALLKEGAL